jgi:hypothetical protein
MMKNRQHQQKGKPHILEKSQGTAISVEDAIIIIRGLKLCGMHCTVHPKLILPTKAIICRFKKFTPPLGLLYKQCLAELENQYRADTCNWILTSFMRGGADI